MREKKLVFGYGYLININIEAGDDCQGLPQKMPIGSYVKGYYGGFLGHPGGAFRDLGNLASACAEVAQASAVFSSPVNMNFEGLVKTKSMTVLVQPIQEDAKDYKSVDELVQKYLKPNCL